MKVIIVCLVAVAWFQLAQAQSKTYVKLYPKTVNCLEANMMCQNLGGSLPDIGSQAALDAILAYIRTSPEILDVDRKKPFWVGRDDAADEGVWRTSKGGPSTGFGWCKNEPNNAGGNEDCAVYYQENNNCLIDVPATFQAYFICSFKK